MKIGYENDLLIFLFFRSILFLDVDRLAFGFRGSRPNEEQESNRSRNHYV